MSTPPSANRLYHNSAPRIVDSVEIFYYCPHLRCSGSTVDAAHVQLPHIEQSRRIKSPSIDHQIASHDVIGKDSI
jgi:hypothetical protein